MSNDVSGFLSGGGAPAAKFKNQGDTVTGKIIEPPSVQQQKDPETGKLLTFEDGNPKVQLVIKLQTDLRDPEIDDDDGTRRLFVTATNAKQGGGMKGAFQRAGVRNPEVGGTLSVTYTHDGEASSAYRKPPKQYQVSYQPPSAQAAAAFIGAGAQAAAPAPVAYAPPAPPAEQPPAGITPEMWASFTPEAKAALKAMNA